MGMLEDVLKALERVPGWKRIAGLPAEVDALRARVQALEARLAPATGEQCPKCRVMAFRLASSRKHPTFGDAGVMEDRLVCEACGYEDFRTRE